MKDTDEKLHWDSGEFLRWWIDKPLLKGKAREVFQRYYSNYHRDFSKYMQRAWTDRHLELENESKALIEKDTANLLDLGCGTGSVSLYLASKFPQQLHVLGIDINGERLFCAEERKKVLEREMGIPLNCNFKLADLESLGENESFDLIYLEETLHHLEPRMKVIKKISRLLKDGGVIIISEVNAYNLFMQFRLLRQRGLTTIGEKKMKDGSEVPYGIERILTASRVAGLFKAYGLSIKSLRYFRIFSAKFGKLFDENKVDLFSLESIVCKLPFFRELMSVHYNIVLEFA
jgi:ubiquinone/menaquinone biosynthesis C-methylase UbiE